MEHKEVLVKDSIIPITLSKQIKITRQMEKCVCKIHKNGYNASGFFLEIPFDESKIKVLVTNNHVLKENDIQDNKIISFSINNDIKAINIGKERMRYTSKKYDVTIIEIKESDELKDIVEYLEIDDINSKVIKEKYKLLSNDHLNNLYKNESLYTLNYYEGKEIMLSYGLFMKIEGSKIYHKCTTDYGSSGSPILSLQNNKVIGVHYGGSNFNFNYNFGTLLAYPIIEFQEKELKKGKKIIRKKFNSMTIRYKIVKTVEWWGNRSPNLMPEEPIKLTKLRLFGEEFVKNNKNNCIIEINGKTQELVEHIDITEKMKMDGYFDIKLKEIKTITNMSHMFCRGNTADDAMLIISIPDIANWDTKYVTDMSYLFCCCEELEILPNISTWDVSNVEDMSNMISYCKKLVSLPDISNWNTKNVRNMSHMFANDSSLESLPDISKFNTSNVRNMEHMFTRCGIKEFPDISKWDMSNVRNMKYMFSFIYLKGFFPNISRWNIINANAKGMFYSCIGFLEDEFVNFDISKWKIKPEQLLYIFFHSNWVCGSVLIKISSNFKIGGHYLYSGFRPGFYYGEYS